MGGASEPLLAPPAKEASSGRILTWRRRLSRRPADHGGGGPGFLSTGCWVEGRWMYMHSFTSSSVPLVLVFGLGLFRYKEENKQKIVQKQAQYNFPSFSLPPPKKFIPHKAIVTWRFSDKRAEKSEPAHPAFPSASSFVHVCAFVLFPFSTIGLGRVTSRYYVSSSPRPLLLVVSISSSDCSVPDVSVIAVTCMGHQSHLSYGVQGFDFRCGT